jgi:MFS transporter, putative metabolite:H+ symporter
MSTAIGEGTRRSRDGRPEATIAARLDRLPLYGMHRRLALVVGIGTFFDPYNIFLGGVLAAVLEEP